MNRSLAVALLLTSACAPPPSAPAPAQADRYDVVIANGRIIDGTGAPWFVGDVGIVGDRVTAVGKLADKPATTRIDAAGAYVAPGFIDMLGQSELNVLADARAASKITQGITTEITGEGPFRVGAGVAKAALVAPMANTAATIDARRTMINSSPKLQKSYRERHNG